MAVLQDININVHGQPSEKRLQTFLRLSQNENGRMINFRVLGSPLPSNCTATFSGTKPDGNVYSKTGTVTGNFVVIDEDIQMTAVAGVWDAKLDIINGTHNIMTALIRVVVDADVVDPDAIASDSQLQGLVAEAKYYAEHARTDAYGSPLTAPTKAQMTDHTRVYVYTGSEPNMVAGNWYLWNGSAWVSGGVYNAVAVQTDTTLSVAGKAADAKKTGDEISSLKEDLKTIVGDYKTLDQFPLTVGIINSTGSWVYTSNNNYKHVVVPVTGGESVSITGNSSYNTQIAFLKTYSAPVSGSADFSEATGFTGRIQLAKGSSYSYTVPSDATYMYILMSENSNDTSPSALVIGGIDYFKEYHEVIEEALATVSADHSSIGALENTVSGLNYRSTDSYPETLGMIKADGTWGNIATGNSHRAIPVKSGDRIEIIGNTDNNSMIAFLKSYSVVNGASADFSDSYQSRINIAKSGRRFWTVPSDTTYLIVHIMISSNNVFPIRIRINHVDITDGLTANLEELYSPDVVKWCVMGDSIPNGYHSELGGSGEAGEETSETVRWRTWAYLIAQWNHWQIDNIAIGGSGYLLTRNGEAGYTLGRTVDFTKYNLVTIAYGINDWKGNQVMGDITDDPTGITPTTVIGAIKATIEGILASNPNIKIIIITPLNCYGYNHDYGTEATNWALGYEFSNSGTLESFVQKLIEVCNYYGIQYIDMTHYSPINRKNLPTMVPDGVHPSLACHSLIAHQLSKQITF